jgi:hypothetical protein
MTIEDVESEGMAELSFRDHLEALLDSAADETARFHARHALQLHIEAPANGDGNADDARSDDADSRAT